MSYKIEDVVFETGKHWILREKNGFKVFKNDVTHSVLCATIGYTGAEGLKRAKREIERREQPA